MSGGRNVSGMANGAATELIEATATSIGAGMLLGGFLAGVVSTILRFEPSERERYVVAWGSFAGVAVVVVATVEAITR